jgi:hypothetical protein
LYHELAGIFSYNNTGYEEQCEHMMYRGGRSCVDHGNLGSLSVPWLQWNTNSAKEGKRASELGAVSRLAQPVIKRYTTRAVTEDTNQMKVARQYHPYQLPVFMRRRFIDRVEIAYTVVRHLN